MSDMTCPKCGLDVAPDDVFCPSCDCVLDVQQVLDEAEGTAEIDILATSGGSGEEVLFDPESDDPDLVDDAAVPRRLDADLAAELAQVLEDGTGTVELGDVLGDDLGDGDTFDVDEPLDAEALFEEPDASVEGDPVPPPVFEEGSGSYRGEALILGDVPADGSDLESMLSDATGAILLPGCALEPAPVYVALSVQQLTAPTAVLATKGELPRMMPLLSPFERHIVGFVDGKRTVLRIAKKTGMSMSDVVVALGMLGDRGLLELVGNAKLKGAPAPVPALMDLPLDALTPLELPADALTPLASERSPQERTAPSPFEDEELAVRPAGPVGGVRPALSLKPATAATAPRAGLTVRDEPPPNGPKSNAPSKPRSGLVVRDLEPKGAPEPPRPATAATVAAAAPAAKAASRAVDPVAHARAMQLIEVALKEMQQGRKVTALSWVKMAAQLVPGDEKIESLLASFSAGTGAPGNLARSIEAAPAPPASDDNKSASSARTLEASGDFMGAANAYRRAIKQKPSDPELYNRLGIVLAVRLKDLIGATAALKKALELAPTNLAYRSNLGKVVKMAAGQKLDDDALYGGDEAHKLKPGAEEKKPSSFLDRLKGLRKG